MKHLAIFDKETAENIFSGKKTVEIRLSKTKTVPYGQINSSDIVYIKVNTEGIIGQFRVQKVISIDGIKLEDVLDIKKRFGKQISENEYFWENVMEPKYVTLIFVEQSIRFLTPPIKVDKKNIRGWLVLE